MVHTRASRVVLKGSAHVEQAASWPKGVMFRQAVPAPVGSARLDPSVDPSPCDRVGFQPLPLASPFVDGIITAVDSSRCRLPGQLVGGFTRRTSLRLTTYCQLAHDCYS
jgi:hypothetical protein